MRLISICINRQYLYYSLFDKDSENILLIENDRIAIPQNQSHTELMGSIYTLTKDLLRDKNLNKAIIVTPSSNATITSAMMITHIMTSGITTLSCLDDKISVDYKSTANISPKKLGYPGKTKNSVILEAVDNIFPNMTYKNNDMRKTVLLGYEELL